MNSLSKKTYSLLIIGSSQGHYGGIEAYMIALAEAASMWPEYEVKLCFKLVKGASATAALIDMAKGARSLVYFVERSSKELAQLISWSDILHVQNIPPDVIFLARLQAKKVFLTIHNRRLPRFDFHNFIWGIAIRFVHRRWFNSNFVWSTWEPQGKSSSSACIPTICKLPNTWCPPDRRKGFLFIGRWIENKGIEELLQAYALGEFNPDEWPLTVLGDGPLKPKILGLVKDLHLKNVSMPGFVDDETKAEHIATARWVLAPARTHEDLGLTPIEARSVGVPSIVTRDGGLPEAGGPAALIAEPGSVTDLLKCMREAVVMTNHEYEARGALAKQSLDSFLKPIEFYRHAYVNN